MKKLLLFSFLLVVGSVLFVSCAKEDETPQLPEDIRAISEISHALDQAIVDFQSMGNQATSKNLKAVSIQDGTVLPSKSNIIILNDTTLITIPFGSAGTLCGDGRFRKGTITITASDRPSITKIGSTLTFQTSNYEVDGYKIDLTKTVTYKGIGTTSTYPYGYLEYSVDINRGKIISPNGDTAIVTIDHNRKLLNGELDYSVIGWAVTGDCTIDVFPGPNSKNFFSPFTDIATITTDIVKPLWYRYLISGEEVHTLSTGKIVSINYGSGSVYDKTTWRGRKTITVNGISTESQQN